MSDWPTLQIDDADYILTSDGTTVTASPTNPARAAYSGVDGGAVLTSVLGAISNLGTVLFQSGDYPWSSVPLIQRNYASPSIGSGVTITIATPGVFTKASNQLANGDQVTLFTTGALPTGLSGATPTSVTPPTTYFVVSNGVDGAGKFRLALTAGGAAINTTGSQSGTHWVASETTTVAGRCENPRMLRILGNNARIVLSTGGPSFLSFGRTADYDSFANFELGGFIVDATGQPATGVYHTLIGTVIWPGPALNVQRCNFYNIYIHDNRVINMRADMLDPSANARYGIWIESTHPANNEGANNYMLGFLLERNRFEGGNVGAVVAAVSGVGGGNASGLRIYGGGWTMRDMWHSTLNTPTGHGGCSNYQFGGGIASYSALINDQRYPSTAGLVCERLYGCGSSDDGLETNSFETISVTDCVMEDSWTEGFFPSNFNYVNGVDGTAQGRQRITYTRCTHRNTSFLAALQNYGWVIQGWYADTGTLTLTDCAYESRNTLLPNGPSGSTANLQLAIFHQNAGQSIIRRIVIKNFVANYDNVTNSTATDGYLNCFDFNGKDPTELIVDDVYITAVGARTGAGQIYVQPFKIEGGDYRVDIDGVTFDDRITGRVSDTTRFIEVGPNALAATFTVTIATPAVFSAVAHGLESGTPVVLTTSGALPTGLTAGNTYYVIAAGLTLDVFEVATTLGGAAVNTSGTQSGTHTVTRNSQVRGRIANIKWLRGNIGDNSPRGVWVYAATVNTINGMFKIENVDMAALAGATPVYFADTVNDAKTIVLPGWITKAKIADTTVASTSTLASDPDMLFQMLASKNYRIRGVIFFDTTAAADFKYGFSGPASPTLVRIMRTDQASGSGTAPTLRVPDVANVTTQTDAGTGTTGGYVGFDMIWKNGSTAGIFAFQWAQGTLTAANTTALAGSYIEYMCDYTI